MPAAMAVPIVVATLMPSPPPPTSALRCVYRSDPDRVWQVVDRGEEGSWISAASGLLNLLDASILPVSSRIRLGCVPV